MSSFAASVRPAASIDDAPGPATRGRWAVQRGQVLRRLGIAPGQHLRLASVNPRTLKTYSVEVRDFCIWRAEQQIHVPAASSVANIIVLDVALAGCIAHIYRLMARISRRPTNLSCRLMARIDGRPANLLCHSNPNCIPQSFVV